MFFPCLISFIIVITFDTKIVATDMIAKIFISVEFYIFTFIVNVFGQLPSYFQYPI